MTRRTVWAFLVMLFVGCIGPILYAQAVADPAAAAPAAAMGQQSIGSLLLSFFMPRFLNWLKLGTRFPLLKDGAWKLNRAFALLVSGLQGAGLTWAYHTGQDGWQFALGSKHSSFEEFLFAAAMAFAAQQYFFEQLPSEQSARLAAAFREANVQG